MRFLVREMAVPISLKVAKGNLPEKA
jgi:hypothetical protein